MFRSANEESLMRASRRTCRPCESTFKDCSLNKNKNAPIMISLGHGKRTFRLSNVFSIHFPLLGCYTFPEGNIYRQKDLISQLKIDFLLSKERIPRAFNDKSLKFMFWCPMSEEISCKLQMRKANANDSFEQQAISCLSMRITKENRTIRK